MRKMASLSQPSPTMSRRSSLFCRPSTIITKIDAHAADKKMLAITSPFGLLVTSNVPRDLAMMNAHRLNAYYSSYPYYSLRDVAKTFKVADNVAINIFDMDEMPIINGHYFVSARGLVKLLMFFGEDPVGTYMAHVKSTIEGHPVSIDSLKTCIVRDRKKMPTMCRATSWPIIIIGSSDRITLPTDRETSPSDRITPMTGVFPATLPLPKAFLDKTTVKGWKQLTSGCTQTHLPSRMLGISRDSPNVKKKRDGRVITINKKYRPLLAEREIDEDVFVEAIMREYPTTLVTYVYGDDVIPANVKVTMNTPSDGKDGKCQKGYIIEYNSGDLSTFVGDDPSTIIDVARACPIVDVGRCKDSIKSGWTFDELCMMYGV